MTLRGAVARILPLILAAAALWVLWRELRGLSWTAFSAAVAGWGWPRLAGALALVAGAYAGLVANEQIALRWVGARVRLRSGAAASFIAYAFANNLGMGVLMGGALRAGVYSRFGVSLVQVAKVTAYGTLTFSLGVALLLGGALVRARPEVFELLRLSPAAGRAVGALLILVPFGYVAACAGRRRPIRVFGRSFETPSARLAAVQTGFGLLDVSCSAALLWLLLGAAAPHFVVFLGAYLVSIVAGLVSGVPGGVGVFESVMLKLLPSVDRAALAAALLGYRLTYYLAPLIVALVVLALRGRGAARPPPHG